MKLTKNPVFLHYISKFMGILLFLLKFMYISLLLKMKYGFPDQQKSWPVPLSYSTKSSINYTYCLVELGTKIVYLLFHNSHQLLTTQQKFYKIIFILKWLIMHHCFILGAYYTIGYEVIIDLHNNYDLHSVNIHTIRRRTECHVSQTIAEQRSKLWHNQGEWVTCR